MDFAVAMIVLMFLGAIGLVLWIQVARVRRHRRRQGRSWRAIAQRRAAAMVEPQGLFGHWAMAVPREERRVLTVMVVGGVVIDREVAGKYSTTGGWHTCVDVPYEAGYGASFSVRKRELLDGKRARFGDAELDKRFAIEGTGSGWAEAWSPRARELLRGLDKRVWLVSGGNVVTAVYPGVLLDEATVDSLIDLVDELARSPLEQRAAA